MKKIITLFGILLLFGELTFATKHTIRTLSMSFSPEETTAQVGDSIEFIVSDIHTATQVSLSTWEAGFSTPLSGGFNFSSGTYLYILTAKDLGTIYFVCIPHVSMGMKARVTVVPAPTGIVSPENKASIMKVFPTVLKENETISVEVPNTSSLKVQVYSIGGKEVKKTEIDDSKLVMTASFGTGVYVIKAMDSEGKTYAQKIVVE